jgi:hypothetical protein
MIAVGRGRRQAGDEKAGEGRGSIQTTQDHPLRHRLVHGDGIMLTHGGWGFDSNA